MWNNNRWPSNFSGSFVAGANDHASYYTNGQLLGGLSGCRDAGSAGSGVAIEALEIPTWVLLVGGGLLLLVLLKKKGR